MMRTCPSCGGRVLTASMTTEEEERYAAAFQCLSCGKRHLEKWPDRKKHQPIDPK
jgi:transcription elongation factor Elf1